MKYNKSPLSINKQLNKLVDKGLQINNTAQARKKLKNVNYYRLSSYFVPFYKIRSKKFKAHTIFEDILDLYEFDNELRKLVFSCIQTLEIAVRSRIINNYSCNFNAHWFENLKRFKSFDAYSNFQKSALKVVEENRSKEKFIGHYLNKYDDPILPSNWMVIEMLTLGQTSRLYKSLKDDRTKKSIAKDFGITEVVLESWLHNLNYIRNITAHHYRLWNRDLRITPKNPRRVRFQFLNVRTGFSHHKLYFSLSVMIYMINCVDANNQSKIELINYIDSLSSFYRNGMGFPTSYKIEPLWNV